MRLDAATIAGLARDAGFLGRAVHVVTAIAVTGSGGLTHYHARAGVPGAGDWRGLYAMNVDQLPDLVDVDLYDPYVATKTAHDLTDAWDSFAWSGVYRAGTWARHEAKVATEASRLMAPVPHGDVIPMFAGDLASAHSQSRLREIRSRIVNYPTVRRTTWPTVTS